MFGKAFLLLAFLVLATEASALTGYEAVKAGHRRSDARLLDRRGELLHELRIDRTGRRLDWVELKDISPSLVKAVLESEDRHFYRHSGVDWQAAGAAAAGRLFGTTNRGASTISMQLAVMLQNGGKPGKRKNLEQKWAQMGAARELEKRRNP